NSYNQHMHVLVCVESTYFYNTENYVNQKQWIQFWKRAMKLDYDPNVKVQMIRPKNKHKSDIKSAIDETAKYTVKDTDFKIGRASCREREKILVVEISIKKKSINGNIMFGCSMSYLNTIIKW